MFNKLGFKMLALMCMLSVSVIFGTTSKVYSGQGNPPPEGAHLLGPGIIGHLTITDATPYVVDGEGETQCGVPVGRIPSADILFSGTCKGTPGGATINSVIPLDVSLFTSAADLFETTVPTDIINANVPCGDGDGVVVQAAHGFGEGTVKDDDLCDRRFVIADVVLLYYKAK